jgi:AcrR family transcriptional regulator
MAPPETTSLRQRILDTSRALLESEGLASLSLREVARRAGVTHQAPYHHFGDRETILAELVTEGFEQLATRLAAANDRSIDPREHLQAAFEAYVGFAIDHPGVFRVMFRPELCDAARFPAAVSAGNRAHGELQRMVARVHGPDDGQCLASLHWAQVHGLACLMVDGPLGLSLRTPEARRAHMQAVGRELVARLNVDPPGP